MAKRSGPLYKVVYAENQRRAVRLYGTRAARRGILGAYLDAIRAMHEHLTVDPVAWGDPQNRLRHLGLLLCHRIEGPLRIHYAVDKTRRIVYLRTIQPMPGQGLD
jgi:hypothetical protein